MGLQLASAYVSIYTNTSGLGSSLNAIESAYISTFESIERAALGIMGSIAAASTGIITRGLQEAGTYEQRFLAIEVLLGSLEEAEDMFARMETFAVKTPFEISEIIQASRSLIQFGERGEEVIDSLTFLGNATAATGTNFKDITRIYNQVRGNTKLLRSEFNQLAERGIISIQDLEKHFGKSSEDIFKSMSKGEIKFEDLRTILENLSKEGGRYFNMMERQAQTFLGAISNLKDVSNISLRIVGASFLGLATKITQSLTASIGVIMNLIKATGDLIPNIMAATVAVSALTTAILSLRVGLKMLGITWKGLLIGTGIGAILLGVAVAIGAVVTAMQRLTSYTSAALSKLGVTQEVMLRLRAAWAIFSSTIIQIATAIKLAFIDLATYILGLFGVSVNSMGGSFVAIVGNMLLAVSNFVLNATAWFQALISSWRLIWANFGAIASFGISYLIDMFLNFTEVFSQLMGYALNRTIIFVVTFVTNVVNLFKEMVLTIGMLIVQIPSMIKRVFSGEDLSDVLMQALMQPFKNISAFMEGLKGTAPDMNDVFGMSGRTKGKFDEVKDVFGEIAKKQEEIRKGALEGAKPPVETEEDKKEEEKKKGSIGIKEGTYGFIELGQNIQKAMLGGDKQDRMISLLEVNNDLQRQMISTEKTSQKAGTMMQGTSTKSKPNENQTASLLETGNLLASQILEAIKTQNLRGGMLT